MVETVKMIFFGETLADFRGPVSIFLALQISFSLVKGSVHPSSQ